jgi:FAD/FMN-containing dehydrogenase
LLPLQLPSTRAAAAACRYRSAIFTKPIPREGLQEIVALLLSTEKIWKLFQWKAYGGAFDSIPASFNAFPHRKGVIMHSEFGTSFGYQRAANELPSSQADVVRDWFARASAVMDKYATEARYNGYVCLCDNVAQYFGPNFARLRRAKKKYDPSNVFRNALSVPPASGDTTLE